MTPKALPLILLCFFAAVSRLCGDFHEDVGWNRLEAELGENIPIGRNIGVSLVESPVNGNHQPNTENMEFAGKTFDMKSDPSGRSEHATVVGQMFFGNTVSMAPAVDEIDVYNANVWVVGDFLRTGTEELPAVETKRVQNHSWTGNTNERVFDIEANRRLDYAIERDRFVSVVALSNFTTGVRPLIGHAYNTITVGKPNGDHSRDGTVFDEPGRIRPDLVSPGDAGGFFTSYSAPVVSAAAAMLLEEADRTPGLANARDRPEVIKSVLMAGADKEPFPEWERSDDIPMDEVFGAGQLNVYNSYRILTGGEYAPATDGFVADSAWHLGDTSAGDSFVYFFSFEEDRETFTANLTWHRLFDLDGGTDFQRTEPLVARLELRLFEAEGFEPGAEVQVSTDPVNNTQHLFAEDLPAGQYALRVDVVDDPAPDGSAYALAWDAIPVIPPPPATFAAWQEAHFTPDELDDPGVSGPEADPAGDGVPNLLVYALAGDPHRTNRDRLPVRGIETIGGDRYLSLTFRRPAVVEDIAYRIDVSDDLVEWEEDLGVFVEETEHDDGTITRTYRDAQPIDGQQRRFLRLTVMEDP